jgi:hypothetical protein
MLHRVKLFESMVFSGRFYFSGDFTSVAEKTVEDPSLSFRTPKSTTIEQICSYI